MFTWLTTALVISVQLPELSASLTVVNGRQKLPIGQHFIALRRSADTYVALHDVVVRSEIGIANRPVIAVPVARRRLEIVIAQAVTLTAPDQRSPAEHAQPLPCKRLARGRAVWIFQIVDEPLVVIFHARVALLLDGPRAHDLGRVIAVFELVGRHVLGKLFRGDRAACFEQGDFQPRLGKLFRGPAARGARSHNHGVGFVTAVWTFTVPMAFVPISFPAPPSRTATAANSDSLALLPITSTVSQ